MAGVLGVVPGIMGLLQANEAIKLLLGIGESLAGRLLLFDALDARSASAAPARPGLPGLLRRGRRGPGAGRPLAASAASATRPFALGGAAGRRGSTGRAVSTVRIPPVLRASVGGAEQVEVPGATVGELLDGLVGATRRSRDQLFEPDGELNGSSTSTSTARTSAISTGRDAGRRARRAPDPAGDGRGRELDGRGAA